ncbi:hypothetical protein PIB30_096768 [Stylosanthes scabra]|uniref:Uncharacterized protein n=1 Tax=Stylosanthes scabra TaxID=79078 RepID=A0ABU6XSW1_9FABA|nr:hypothetical protein [Stylosanthes scabra]
MEPPKSKCRLGYLDLAFLHQFQPDMRLILPEICWKEVEDWEIEWVEMRAKLLQQPHIDPKTTKFEPEKEITAASTKIQVKKEAEIYLKSDSTYHSEDEVEEEDAKLEENLLGWEHSYLEMKLTAEENAIVGVDDIAKEEVDDTVSKSGENWRQNGNEDGGNNVDLSLFSSMTNRSMVVPSSSVGVLQRGWLHRASPIAAKPPPFLAVVLPWDRDGDDLAMVQVAHERGPEEKRRRAEIVVPKTDDNIGL